MFKALSRFFGLRKVPSIISKLPSPHAGVRTNKSPQETSLVLRARCLRWKRHFNERAITVMIS